MSEVTMRPRMRPKEFRFPLEVRWAGGRKVTVEVEGKAPLDVVPPPEFHGTEPEVWSPEDLFVAASAACFAVTFTGLAQKADLDVASLAVHADGVAGGRADGHFGFTRVLLDVSLGVPAGEADLARGLVDRAEERCLVSASLDLPVEVSLTLHEL